MNQRYLKEKVQEGLKDKDARVGRFRAFGAIRPAMLTMSAKYPNLREQLRELKEHSIGNLPTLTAEAINSLKEKGCNPLSPYSFRLMSAN